MSLKNVAFASLCYCATCFAGAAGSYALMWATGNLKLRDPATNAVVENATIPSSSVLPLSLFFGVATTVVCLGGLLGVWVLAARLEATRRLHAAGGMLLALLGGGTFLFGASVGAQDHLLLRALAVAVVSLVAATLVRVYVAGNPRLVTSS